MIGMQYFLIQIQKRFGENYRTIFKWTIVVSVLLTSLALALINNERIVLLPVVVVLGVAVLLLFLRQPQIGILLMVFSSLLVPAPFATNQNSIVNPAMLIQLALLGFWVLDMVARQRRIYLAPSRTTIPLILFLIWVMIELINGQINYYHVPELASLNAQVSQIMIIVLSGVTFLLVGNRMVSLVWLQRLSWLFIILSAFYIVMRLLPPLSDIVFRIYQYGSDASIFWIWLVAILSSQLLLNRQLSQLKKITLGALLAGAMYIALVVAYSWKSGWLPALITVAVIIFVGYPRFRAVAVFMGIIVLILGFTEIGNLVSGGEDYSLATRSEALALFLRIVKVNPIMGLGPANIYWYTPLFPIRGYSVNYNSHNNYIDIFSQFGIIGLVLFLWFVWEIGKLAWRLKDAVPDGFERAYVIGAIGGLVGMLVSGLLGDWFFPFVYNVSLVGYRSSMLGWLFLGGLVLLEQLYLRNGMSEVANRL